MRTTIAYTALFLAFYFIGAYATTDISRLLRGSERSVLTRDCFCPACGYTIPLKEQIPIFSYLKNRGRCRNCKAAIPFLDIFPECFLFPALSLIAILWSFSWKAYFASVLLYEGLKLFFILYRGPRKRNFFKSLMFSLFQNLLIFALLAVIFGILHLLRGSVPTTL